MNGYKVLLVAIVSVFLGLAGFGLYVFLENRENKPEQSSTPVPFINSNFPKESPGGLQVPGGLINFTHTGNLVRNNPGLKPGIWYIIFETPGNPGLVAELSFDGDSICRINTANRSCGAMTAVNGTRAEVEGVSQQNGTVLVRQLDIYSQ